MSKKYQIEITENEYLLLQHSLDICYSDYDQDNKNKHYTSQKTLITKLKNKLSAVKHYQETKPDTMTVHTIRVEQNIEEANLVKGDLLKCFWCENLSAYVNLLDENYFDLGEFFETEPALMTVIDSKEVQI